MARKPTGNPRGRYRDPSNENVACQYACGKRGRKGPMVAHERHYCPKRPGAQERDERARAERAEALKTRGENRQRHAAIPPAPQGAIIQAKPQAGALKVTRETVELVAWPEPSGA